MKTETELEITNKLQHCEAIRKSLREELIEVRGEMGELQKAYELEQEENIRLVELVAELKAFIEQQSKI